MVEPPAEGNTPKSRLLVGDTARRYALELLKRACTAGLISFPELERRLEIVYSARVRSQLRPALEDLPEYPRVRATKRLDHFWLD